MCTITTPEDAVHGERLRRADRAQLAVGARAASRPARGGRPAATPASRIILLRPAV